MKSLPLLAWLILLAYIASPFVIFTFGLSPNSAWWLPAQLGITLPGICLTLLAARLLIHAQDK